MDLFYRIVSMLGGLSMFLYGMRVMGDGLSSCSGGAMKAALEKVTSRPALGFLLGALVTCMIQSSHATIVLTVGLVGAGFLTFRQSIGIVLGANVGTAITAQIIRLMDVQAGTGSVLYFFNAKNLAPMALIAGIVLIMFVKRGASKNVGTIAVGFGVLFMGLISMSDAVSSFGDSLSRMLTAFEGNYFLGFLAGAGVTAVIQSSSAVIGILQSVASSVGVRFCGVFAVIIGVNVADSISAYAVSRIGAKPEQIRTVGVANVHGLFRLVPAVLLLPMSGQFARLAEKLVPDKPMDEEDQDILENLRELDSHLVTSPSLALAQSAHLIGHMGDVALHNYDAARQQLFEFDPKRTERIAQREELLDRMADAANQYVVSLSPYVKRAIDNQAQNFQIKALTCFERIGDLAQNIQHDQERLAERGKPLSDDAMTDLEGTFTVVRDILAMTVDVFQSDDLAKARAVEPLEEVIDDIIEVMKARHVERMTSGSCDMFSGIQYENILQNLERVSDQCSDLAVYMLGRSDAAISGQEHHYLHELHHSDNAAYQRMFRANYEKYFQQLHLGGEK